MATVTILTTCYNHENFIGPAIESVISQTFKDWKMVLLDDHSTDGSRDVIKAFAAKDPRIEYYFDDQNLRKAARLNTYLDKIDSPFVALLDSDDYWRPDRLENQLAVFEAHPEVSVCYSDGLVVDSREKPKSGELWEEVKEDQRFSEIHRVPGKRSGDLYAELLRGNFIFYSSTLIRHSVMKGIEFVSVHNLGEDWFFFLDIAKRGGKYHYTEEPLTYYRIHGSGMMQSTWKQDRSWESREIVYKERGDDMSKRDRAVAAYVLSRMHDRYGSPEKARHFGKLCVKDNPFFLKGMANYVYLNFKKLGSRR